MPVRAIELLRQEIPKSVVFAVGGLNRPQVVVNAMLAGAREFIERPTTTTDLRMAFIRLIEPRRSNKKGRRV